MKFMDGFGLRVVLLWVATFCLAFKFGWEVAVATWCIVTANWLGEKV